MIKQISARLEGGSEADTIDVQINTEGVEPTGEHQEINGQSYYRVQLFMSPVGSSDFEYVTAKMARDPEADIYIEGQDAFAALKKANESLAKNNAERADVLYTSLADPSRFADITVRYLDSDQAAPVTVGPNPFVQGSRVDLDEGIGQGWQVKAEVKRNDVQGRPVTVDGTFYVVSAGDTWTSYLEIDPDDLTDTEESAGVEEPPPAVATRATETTGVSYEEAADSRHRSAAKVYILGRDDDATEQEVEISDALFENPGAAEPDPLSGTISWTLEAWIKWRDAAEDEPFSLVPARYSVLNTPGVEDLMPTLVMDLDTMDQDLAQKFRHAPNPEG